MIESVLIELPHGIRLSCRTSGERGRPLMLFLHGFPEAAFAWDVLLQHFARPENGGFHCVAPNLRGFERSSAPSAVDAYRPKCLMADFMALAAIEGIKGQAHTLVGHDWGGAIAWGMAHARPDLVQRLVIINAPHPASFARELRENPEQQRASAYMHLLARPGSEQRLAQDDYRRLWPFFTRMKAGEDGFGWLTEAVRQQYRSVWDHGLTGACNLYRATPLKPPRPGRAGADAIRQPSLAQTRVDVPTLLIWGMQDTALMPALLEGLQDYVPQLTVHRMNDSTHWIVHEQPLAVAAQMNAFIAGS